jgi:hypothetical protein
MTELTVEFLTVSEESLSETTAGTPAITYMEAGPLPAFDCCPALIVYASLLGEELTSPTAPSASIGQRARFGRINLVTLNVVVLRCAAEIGPNGIPDTAAKNAVAATVQEDGWALWNGLYTAIREERFKDLCSYVHFDTAQAIPEQGGCVGWYMTIRASLDGFPLTVAT